MLRTCARQSSRREFIAAGAAAALGLRSGLSLAAPAAVTGSVFFDRRGAGSRGPGDPGLAGVMVSNGREVALTDADGRWQLPARHTDEIFLIKPAHWTTRTGSGGVPLIAAHQLARPAAAAAAGNRVPGGLAGIDFALIPAQESAQFEAVLMADTQPADATELGYLCDDIISTIVGTGAAFGINHGDVVFDDLSLYARYLKMLGTSGIPWHHCPGNHDIDKTAHSDETSRDTWQRTFGPRHYAFQYADATFIILDNVYWHGRNPAAANSAGYHGLIGAEQLQFVRNVLANVAEDRLVALSMHIPLMNYQNAEAASDNTVDRRALLDLLSGRPHTVSFAGHMHLTEHHYFGPEAGFHAAKAHHHHVLTAASGGWWSGAKDARGIPAADAEDGNPNGYHMLSVDGTNYSTRFVPAAGKPAAQLRASIETPAHAGGRAICLRQGDLEDSELVVNVFDGGPATRVRYGIGGVTGEPRTMQRIACPDPHVERVFSDHANLQKPWMRALSSSHIWRARLPSNLRPGAYCAAVEAENEYGRRFSTHLLFEVAPDFAT
jgi:C terminal of Calcineurin-like phosphoesterase/Calcineurin-like phosphoesterase